MAWDDEAVKKRLAEGAQVKTATFDGDKVADTARKVLDLLRAETSGPIEGYAVLTILVEGFRKSYGIYAEQTFLVPKNQRKD